MRQAPAGAMEWHRAISAAPLPGLVLLFAENRWFAPPAAMGSVKEDDACVFVYLVIMIMYLFPRASAAESGGVWGSAPRRLANLVGVVL